MAADPLADVFGPPKGKGASVEEEDSEMAGEFESAIIDAFPELEGKADRIAALKQAIKACYEEA
jgi:hypothetical protein